MEESHYSDECAETRSRIMGLFASLEDTDSKSNELSVLKASVESLMVDYIEHHVDMESEMSSVLEGLQRGMFTQEQLTQMVRSDQDRSMFVLRLANALKLQLECLFQSVGSVIEQTVGQGGTFPKEKLSNMYNDMNLVMESVHTISRVANTPAKQLNLLMEEVETDLRPQMEMSLSRAIEDFGGKPPKSGDYMPKLEKLLEIDTTFDETKESKAPDSTSSKSPSRSFKYADSIRSPSSSDSMKHSPVRLFSRPTTNEMSCQTDHDIHHDKAHTNEVHSTSQANIPTSDTKQDNQKITSSAIPEKQPNDTEEGGSAKARKRQDVKDSKSITTTSGDNANGGGNSNDDSNDKIITDEKTTNANSSNASNELNGKSKSSQSKKIRKAVGKVGDDTVDIGESGDDADMQSVSGIRDIRIANANTQDSNTSGNDELIILYKLKEELNEKESQLLARESLLLRRIEEIDNEVKARMKAKLRAIKDKLKEKRPKDNNNLETSLNDDISEMDNMSYFSVNSQLTPMKPPTASIKGDSADSTLLDELMQYGDSSRRSRPGSTQGWKADGVHSEGSSDGGMRVRGRNFSASKANRSTPSKKNRKSADKENHAVQGNLLNAFEDDKSLTRQCHDEGSLSSLNTSKVLRLSSSKMDPLPPSGIGMTVKSTEVLMIFAPIIKLDQCVDTKDFDEYLHTRNINIPTAQLSRTITSDSIDTSATTNPTAVINSVVPEVTITHNNVTMHLDSLIPKELPVISQQGGFTTRSYNKQQTRSFIEELQSSENPLGTLYNEYKNYLPDILRAKLLSVLKGDPKSLQKSTKIVDELFTEITTNIEKMNKVASQVLLFLNSCEHLMNELIIMKNNDSVLIHNFDFTAMKVNPEIHVSDRIMSHTINFESYIAATDHFFKKLGEVQILKLWIDLQLDEYRSIFEKMQVLDIGSAVRSSRTYRVCCDEYTICQGRSVDAAGRIAVLKEKCHKHNLEYIRKMSPSRVNAMYGNNGSKYNAVYSSEDVEVLKEYIDEITIENSELKKEVEDLNQEIFKAMQQGDHTPGALLFFAALHDPFTYQALQQLQLQLSCLKGFAESSKHMDFLTLRKRIQVCMSSLPSLEKFTTTFEVMKKKWQDSRLSLFSQRKLTGGDADMSHVCPLCCNDMRLGVMPAPIAKEVVLETTKKRASTAVSRVRSMSMNNAPNAMKASERLKGKVESLIADKFHNDLVIETRQHTRLLQSQSMNTLPITHQNTNNSMGYVDGSLAPVPETHLTRLSTPQDLIKELQSGSGIHAIGLQRTAEI